MYLDIPVYDGDFFSESPNYHASYRLGRDISIKNELERLGIGTLMTCHMSWSHNSFHKFIYRSEMQMLEHMAAKLIEDWNQLRNLQKKPRDTMRICERLIGLRITERARRLIAIGPMYPTDFTTYISRSENAVQGMLRIADAYYERKYGNEAYSVYMQAYTNPDILYVTRQQYAVIANIPKETLIYPYIEIRQDFEEREPLTVELRPREVDWTLQLSSREVDDMSMDLFETAEAWMKIETVEPCNISKDVFASRLIEPEITVDAEVIERMYNEAKDDFGRDKNQLHASVNNTFDFTTLTRQSLAKVRARYAKRESVPVIQQGTLEHLWYQSLFQQRLQRLGGRIVLPEDQTSRRVNNSTYKMLGLYVRAIREYEGREPTSYIVGGGR